MYDDSLLLCFTAACVALMRQVAISFPGAEFLKGGVGSTQHFTDATGRPIASNGAELAEVLRNWLTEDWLEGDDQKGEKDARRRRVRRDLDRS